MKFKRALSVFIDNFNSIYKLLVYQLIVLAICFVLLHFGVIPKLNEILYATNFRTMQETFSAILTSLGSGETDELLSMFSQLFVQFNEFIEGFADQTKTWTVVFFLCFAVLIFQRLLYTIGNFTYASLINDKMSLHAKGRFSQSLIRNLKDNLLYSTVYTAITVCYEVLVFYVGYLVFFKLFSDLFMIVQLFLFIAFATFTISVRLTFMSNFLPAMITGKMKLGKALQYSFVQGGKHFGNLLSNFIVLTLLIISCNVMVGLTTIAVGCLITIPASYTLLTAFIFVSYYSKNNIRYFIDSETVIRPTEEHTPTKQEFFRGED